MALVNPCGSPHSTFHSPSPSSLFFGCPWQGEKKNTWRCRKEEEWASQGSHLRVRAESSISNRLAISYDRYLWSIKFPHTHYFPLNCHINLFGTRINCIRRCSTNRKREWLQGFNDDDDFMSYVQFFLRPIYQIMMITIVLLFLDVGMLLGHWILHHYSKIGFLDIWERWVWWLGWD